MPITHTIQRGDSVRSVAARHGLHWETVWNDGANSQLRQQRKDPNVLYPGDQLVIPDVRRKDVPAAAETRHRFRRLGVPERLQLRLLRNGEPRASLRYTIEADGEERGGATDGDGWIRETVPPGTRRVKLTLLPESAEPEVTFLDVGALDPPDTIEGAQARLANLGLFSGRVTGDADRETAAAIAAFQQSQGLPASGQLDARTADALRREHGS